jgi:predicted DCC family thiol-disulfide oxidoreductase YuxK
VPHDVVLYDGTCGLCHGTVRFLLARDSRGELFRFAPLTSGTARELIAKHPDVPIPDSIVVATTEGALLTRSHAVVHLLARLGGVWRVVSRILWVVPPPLRNLGYDLVARVRSQLFARPVDVCPVVPPELRGRFLA